MTQDYTFTFLDCQSCTAHIHCEQCQDQILQLLTRLEGVRAADVNILQKTMRIDFDGIDPEEIEDALEDAGVFT